MVGTSSVRPPNKGESTLSFYSPGSAGRSPSPSLCDRFHRRRLCALFAVGRRKSMASPCISRHRRSPSFYSAIGIHSLGLLRTASVNGMGFQSVCLRGARLSLYGAAFMAEIYRGGVQSIERGQFEAADALALTMYDKSARHLSASAATLITGDGQPVCDSPENVVLVSVIGLTEVVRANELAVTEYRPLEIIRSWCWSIWCWC